MYPFIIKKYFILNFGSFKIQDPIALMEASIPVRGSSVNRHGWLLHTIVQNQVFRDTVTVRNCGDSAGTPGLDCTPGLRQKN